MSDEAPESTNGSSKHDGAANGGDSDSRTISPARRSEIAKNAALARWNPPNNGDSMPREQFPGILPLGEYLLPCAVLSNRQRVLSERGVTRALGGKRGGSHWLRIKEVGHEGYRPVFLSAHNLAPFVPPSLSVALSNPVVFRTKSGHTGYGILAELLPEVCEVLLKARAAGVLTAPQLKIAATAELLISALAKVGIIALVDEATGYLNVRVRDELHRILDAYVAPELLPWSKRFPDEFYKQLFRLRGWQYSSMSVKRPKLVGKLTAQLVYEKLPDGVLAELRSRNPVVRAGNRRHKHFQLLTEDVGNPHLERHLASVTTLMRIAPNWGAFKRMFDKAFAPEDPQLALPDMENDDDSDLFEE